MSFFYYMRLGCRSLQRREEPEIAYVYCAALDEWRQIDPNHRSVRSSLPYWERFVIGNRVLAFMAARNHFSPYNEDHHRAAMASLARLREEYERINRRQKALSSTRSELTAPDTDVVDVEVLESELLPV